MAMDSPHDDPYGPGCPIRRSTDQRVLAPPRGFSQRATSFIASQCQGIHRMPLPLRLIPAQTLATHAPRAEISTPPLPTEPQSPPHACARSTAPRPQGQTPTSRHVPPHAPSKPAIAPDRSAKPLHHVQDPPVSRQTLLNLALAVTSVRPSRPVPVLWNSHCRIPTVNDPLRSRPGGGDRARTDDLMLAKHALSQLSYAPSRRQRTDYRRQKRRAAPAVLPFVLCLLSSDGGPGRT